MTNIIHKTTRCLSAAAAAVLVATMIAAPALAVDCKRTAGGIVHTPTNVKFDFDSATLSPKEQEKLDKLAKRYAGNRGLEICLIGVTDRSGSAAYNEKLALKRAEAVADFFKSAGFKDNTYQIVARGQAYGDDSWVGKLLGSKKMQSERRVDVLLME